MRDWDVGWARPGDVVAGGLQHCAGVHDRRSRKSGGRGAALAAERRNDVGVELGVAFEPVDRVGAGGEFLKIFIGRSFAQAVKPAGEQPQAGVGNARSHGRASRACPLGSRIKRNAGQIWSALFSPFGRGWKNRAS